MNALTTIRTRKVAHWTLTEGLLIVGILTMLSAAVALPAFANMTKRLTTGAEDLDATVKAQAATFLLVQKISQMQ
jgi:predicted Kef-type K+ transport protein